MKLNSIIERIGFGAKRSKSVDDVAIDKFEDFGVTVGQLYQTFLKKDLSADPAIAQKIMDMVDTDDDNALANQIKDLEFLVNQLPDKAGPKDKIGFKEVANELYSEEFKGRPFMQSTPNEFAYLDFKKWAYPRRGKIKQRLQAVLDNNQADPGVPCFKELTRIWVMWASENDEAFSVVNPTDVGQKDFGRALAVMMKNDNLIINKESNKLLDLKEDDRSKKDKEFDLAQQLSKLTKDDKIKLKKIQQMMAKEKNEEKISGFDYHYTKGTSGNTHQFGRPRMVNEESFPDIEVPDISLPDITPPEIDLEELKKLKKYVKENLRNWFKKEKWKRIDSQGNIAGDCGTMKKGKPTQRCLPLAKARSLTKKQRAATARKKVAGSKKGKQFVSNTPKAKVKLKK